MQTQAGMLHTLPFCVSHLRGWWKLCLTFNKTGGYSKYPSMYMLFLPPQRLAQSTHGFRGKAVELLNEVQRFSGPRFNTQYNPSCTKSNKIDLFKFHMPHPSLCLSWAAGDVSHILTAGAFLLLMRLSERILEPFVQLLLTITDNNFFFSLQKL